MNKESLLSTGDTVEVGVTHEIVIGREKSWIKFGVTTKVREGETGEDASGRASMQMQNEVATLIKDVVAQVERIENGGK